MRQANSDGRATRTRVLTRAIVAAALLSALVASGAFAQGNTQGKGNMNGNVVREQYEWSNIWWDCANDPKLPRVLLIGDSISCGYSAVVTKLLQGKYHVDRLGTSRSINDPVLIKETTMMLEDGKYVAIHFNNGLHGFHLDGPSYAAGLREYLYLLRTLGGDAKLVWGASTPIVKTDDVNALADSNATVTSRNALAAQVMHDAGIPTDDLYQVVIGQGKLRNLGDGYHYNAAGYDLLGKAVTDSILKALQ